MDPRFNVYVTFIPDDADQERDASSTRAGDGGDGEPSRETGLKKGAGVPIKGGKARRRSGHGGGDAGSNSVE